MRKNILFFITALFLVSCSDDDNDGTSKERETVFKEKKIEISDYSLASYSVNNDSEYLIVFESGLGDEVAVWQEKDMQGAPLSLADIANRWQDVVLYDRAGIGKSTPDNSVRSIAKMRKDLETVINAHSNKRKVILVGHSLGGLIIRDYAVKNPEKVAGMLFIDPTHEKSSNITQEQIDMQYDYMIENFGENDGGAKEIFSMIDNLKYMETLGNLPDVPVVVLTSMQLIPEGGIDEEFRINWSNAHKTLGKGVTDFTQVTTLNGHYIWLEDLDWVVSNLDLLVEKVAKK